MLPVLLEKSVEVWALTLTPDFRRRRKTIVHCRWTQTVGPEAIMPHIPAPAPGYMRMQTSILVDVYGTGVSAKIIDEEMCSPEGIGDLPNSPSAPPAEPERKINFREFL